MYFYEVWRYSVIFQEGTLPRPDGQIYFWFQLVKSCLIRSYLILLEQRCTITCEVGEEIVLSAVQLRVGWGGRAT